MNKLTQVARMSGNARLAMLLAMFGLAVPFLSVGAYFLGKKAIREIDGQEGKLKGRGLALAAMVLGGLETAALCLLLFAGVVLPAMLPARQVSRKRTSTTQIRNIHQQLVVFAMSNKGWYPGLTNTGVLDGLAVTSLRDASLGRMKREEFYIEQDLVSPAEVEPFINGKAIRGAATSNGSYAVLEYANPKVLHAKPTMLGELEWRDSLRGTAIVLSDRQLATGKNKPRSIWTH